MRRFVTLGLDQINFMAFSFVFVLTQTEKSLVLCYGSKLRQI